MKKATILIFILLISSCTHLYKLYEYDGAVLKSKFGEIGVSVIGKWNVVSKEPEITESAGPYSIRIGFLTTDKPDQKIMIKIIDVSPSSELISYYAANEVGITKKSFAYKTESKTSNYAVLVSNINSNYKPIKIKFELHYRDEVESFETILKPSYRQERRNNFIDGIMSI